MVEDSEVAAALQELLRTADLNTTTTASVCRQLEKDLGIDLSSRKKFIREQIGLFLSSLEEESQNDVVEEVQDEGREEIENVKDKDDSSNGSAQEEDNRKDVKDEDDSSNGSAQEEDNRLDEKEKVVKKRSGGFTKPCALSPELEEIVGESELARTEVVKRIWVYIRENNLQNPNDRRKILCDEKLYSLFQVKSIDMFKMNQVLSKHIWPIEDLVVPVEPSSKDKQRKRKKEIVSVDPPRKDKQPKRKKEIVSVDLSRKDKQPKWKKESEGDQKKQKGTGSGFLMPLPLSDALVKFIGTGENALPRSEVVKRLWQHIKENNLQDPSDKKQIICDSKLKELFDVDTFVGFTVTKLLTPHFIKEV